MSTYVRNYIKGCATCQQYKINRHPTKPPLQPIPGSKTLRPFAQCSMDLITDLPLSNGYDCILSIVDHGLTKGILLAPTTKTATSDDIAKILIERVFSRFGTPERIISDRDPRFASKSMRSFYEKCRITPAFSTAYHPQTDGSTERFNQEIQFYLAAYTSQHPEKWSEALPILEYVHNSKTHAEREHSPFELIMGYTPPAFLSDEIPSNIPSIQEKTKFLEHVRQAASEAHEQVRLKMAARQSRPWTPFKVGDKVWLDNRNIPVPYTSRKLNQRREGPFTILKRLSNTTYELQLPQKWKIHNRFHASLLTPVEENETYGPLHPNPPPDLVNGEEEYEVEAIVRHRRRRHHVEYCVRWKGYGPTEDSWEPEENLENATDILQEYKRTHGLS